MAVYFKKMFDSNRVVVPFCMLSFEVARVLLNYITRGVSVWPSLLRKILSNIGVCLIFPPWFFLQGLCSCHIIPKPPCTSHFLHFLIYLL